MQADAFYLDAAGRGRRFCIHHAAQGGTTRGLVLYVHPFAEELNKARRMAALQSRALAQAGYAVLQIDLLGCGDSSGDFGDATWHDWVDDVLLGCRWLQHHADAPLWLWGLRVGCLLASDAARQLTTPCHFLFWQPTLLGKLALQQFLRLRVAADMLAGQAKGVMDGLRNELASGVGVEIAGYTLAPGLATGLELATLRPPPQGTGRLVWLELAGNAANAQLAPASTPAIERWRRAGYAVQPGVTTGPSFWQTVEIEEAPQLLVATLGAMSEAIPA